MTMTSSPASGSPKLCTNIGCHRPIHVTRPTWKCPKGCFVFLCDRCSFCDFCLNPQRSILPPNPGRSAAPFRMPNTEGTSDISVSPIAGSAFVAGRTPCLLNSTNTKLEVDPSDRRRPVSRLDARKNSIPKRSSQIRASQMIKDKTTAGNEHNRSRNLFANVPYRSLLSSTRFDAHNPLSAGVPLATPMTAKNQIINQLAVDTPTSRVPPAIPVAVAKNQIASRTPLFRDPPATPMVMAKNQITNQEHVSKKRSSPPTSTTGKQFAAVKARSRNGKARFQTPGKDQLLSRYLPKITDQELKQIAGSSNAKITPLFEKKLTASDVGRIGRLVLPKKCAEIYLPPVNEPLGEPLKIQDLKGNDWDLNFRFWPNNNSRMYVLEGVSPLIKSMDLKEGDTVTFSRLETEGKLVMGYRKAKTASSSNQEMVIASTHDVSKGNTNSTKPSSASQMKPNDPTSNQSEVVRAKASVRAKRKSTKMGSTSKIIEPEKEMIEIELTSKEAQELVRPPPGCRVPKPVVIDGVEIMGFKEDPVIGRPSIVENHVTEMVQWGQCDDCFKWRKVPFDFIVPAGWTCSQNEWDSQRSRCSVTEEMMSDKTIKDRFQGSSKKMKIGNQQPETVVGRGTVTTVIPPDENVAPAPTTTKHPRHRPGCSCIVCIQAPSGFRHNSTCTCGGCMTVRRRHQTVNSRRGKKPSGPTRRKRTRRPAKSTTNPKKPSPQPDTIMKQADQVGGSKASHQLTMKPTHEQPASTSKPLMDQVGCSNPILQRKKPSEDHHPTTKTSSVSAPAKERFLDLNRPPESDDDDSMQ